jgi:hypothetical protein
MANLCDQAIKAFRDRLPVFYQQCRPLLNPLISLLAGKVYLNLENDDLSLWRDEETRQQLEFRNKIVGYLMNELGQKHNGKVQFDDDHDDVFTIVIYWYLKDDSARFLREKKQNRECSLSTAFFRLCERRSPRSVAHVFERGLEYCSPSSPVFIKRESSYEPNSFYGERDVRKTP